MARSRDVALYAIGAVFQQAVAFCSGVLIARWLGPANYGVLSLTRNIFNILLILGPLGLDVALLRHLASPDIEGADGAAHLTSARMIAASFNFFIVLIVATGGGAWLEANVYQHHNFALYLELTFLALPFAADMGILTAAFRAYGKPTAQIVISLIFQPALRLLLVVIFLLLGYGITGILVATVAGYFASSIIMSVILRKIQPPRIGGTYRIDRSQRSSIIKLMRFSGWVMLSLLTYGALRNIDILILGKFRSTTIVGEYAAISTVAQLIQVIPAALSQTLGPTIARLHGLGDIHELKATLNGYLRRSSLLAAPVFAVVAAFSPLLSLVFGHRFHFDPLVAINLATGYLIGSVLGGLGFALSMTGKHRIEFALLCIGAVTALVGCYELAPVLGAHGVSFAISISYLLINVGRAIVVARMYRFIPGHLIDLVPPLLCLALAFLGREIGERLFGPSLIGEFLGGMIFLGAASFCYWQFLFLEPERIYVLGVARSALARLGYVYS